jgi:hypothetical protein
VRPLTGAKANSFGLHSVGLRALLCIGLNLCRRRIFADSEHRCTYSSREIQASPGGGALAAEGVTGQAAIARASIRRCVTALQGSAAWTYTTFDHVLARAGA